MCPSLKTPWSGGESLQNEKEEERKRERVQQLPGCVRPLLCTELITTQNTFVVSGVLPK